MKKIVIVTTAVVLAWILVAAVAQEWQAVVSTPPGTTGVSQTRTLTIGPGLVIEGNMIKAVSQNEIIWGLPAGTTLSPEGLLSVPPTAKAGRYLFEVQARDSTGAIARRMMMLTIVDR